MSFYHDFYLKLPDWNPEQCPSTCEQATEKVSQQKLVRNEKVVRVLNASYRNATVSGVFVLGPDVNLPKGKTGLKQIQVVCGWFGHKLPSKRGIKLRVQLATCVVEEAYSGKVETNIAK